MFKLSNSIYNRLIIFRSLGTVAIMDSSAMSDNERKLSKRARKRLHHKRLREASKMSESERELAKQLKEQKRENASLEKQEDVILEKYLSETDYYFENGLRKVYPYYYEFTAHAKGRWFGSCLVEVYAKEFQNYSTERCLKAIEDGTLLVNGKRPSADHVIKNGDFILNKIHRHELPVTAESPKILVDNEDYLTVDKPASIPIHPCGRYRHNTLIYILAKDHGFRNLRALYRIDRLTSGLVIFCKQEKRTREMVRHISQRQVQKEYLCQVEGMFPCGVVECSQPIGPLSQKFGIYKTDANGKPSRTEFERIGFDGKNSIVKCKPYTGRTHQIRVHLQYLGFPIVNDPLYKGPEWGPNEGKLGDFGKSDEQLVEDLMKKHSSSLYLDTQECLDEDFAKQLPSEADGQPPTLSNDDVNVDHVHLENDRDSPPSKRIKPDCSISQSELDAVPTIERPNADIVDCQSNLITAPGFDSSKFTFDDNCRECKLKYMDPKPENLVMYLHAYKYKGPDWEFSTPLPTWAAITEVTQD